MKKIVRCACFVLVLISILTACTNKNELQAKLRKDESNNAAYDIKSSIIDKNYERFDLLMEKYINDTKIYGTSVSNGIYDKVQIQIAGQTKDYEWSSLADDNYLPSIYYGDVNGDTINECIMILIDDLDDKYISEKCHVIDSETLEEIPMENIIEYLNNNITYLDNDDKIDIMLKDELLYQIDKSIIPTNENSEDNKEAENEIDFKSLIDYSDLVTYKVSSDEVYANVQFKFNDEIIFDTNISYVFETDKMIVK